MNLEIQLASLDLDIKTLMFQLIMWKTDCLRPQISEHPTLFLSICSETTLMIRMQIQIRRTFSLQTLVSEVHEHIKKENNSIRSLYRIWLDLRL